MMSTSPTELGDWADRNIAVTTFDRNLVVTAGAGTGKTTLLIDRVLHLLVRNPEPLKITEIVALTFTNKAADEMKLRLRQRLQSLLDVQLDRAAASAEEEKAHRGLAELIALYQISKAELDARVHGALQNLERSDIGTIHSFAANLLRLYPLEAGVDPQFREDEGAALDRLFDELWDQWLDDELSLHSRHAADWRKVLSVWGLDQIKALAKSMAGENVDLRANAGAPAPVLLEWLRSLERRAAGLIDRHPEDRLNEKLVRAAHAVLDEFHGNGRLLDPSSDKCLLLSEKSISRATQGWSADDATEAQELVRVARGLSRVDGGLTATLCRLLAPYAAFFRERFIGEGHLSFDALLVRARDLVRDHRRVRADLKRRYGAILIDEFQDTDPIQYEILLYLAEAHGRTAADWRDVKITPGKIFVVGDPKQSIYAFRRADIEAYLEVVEKIIKAQNGVDCRLTTNFRSNGAILAGINGAFEALIREQAGVQPPYIAIHPAPGRTAAPGRIANLLLRKITAERELSADAARRLEGQSLATWLQESILGKLAIRNVRGERVCAQAKDVAILLRKLTDIHDYLEPLRRRGIRYVVEGERNFYAAKEIIDAVNLLRAVGNPHDRLALVGVLRSPLGGLTDQEIYELHRANLLSYGCGAKIGSRFPATLAELYHALARLHEETRALPIGAAVAHVFARLPVELLAAASVHGEQAVANLQKLADQAELLGREGLTTLNGAIGELEKRVLEVKEEGESALAEESLDAVRIMSIHKAKGLEFPIVVLAGCQAGSESGQSSDAEAIFDWSTGLTGVRVGSISDLSGLYIAEKWRRRSAEEQKRLLYVAMTRAREHLILSCAPSHRRANTSFLAMLDRALDGAVTAAASSRTVALGQGILEIEVVRENLAAPSATAAAENRVQQSIDWRPFLASWSRRAARCAAVNRSAPFLTPTELKRREQFSAEAGAALAGMPSRLAPSLIVGDLAHRFLQRWNFQAGVEDFARELHDWLDASLAKELQASAEQIESELHETFAGFLRSEVYAELAGARILGREIPLIMPWNGAIMEGVIDVLYEKAGLLYLADYKTDKIAASETAERAEHYRLQAEIYSRAVTQALRREAAAFKIIFLRLGDAVEFRFAERQQLSLF